MSTPNIRQLRRDRARRQTRLPLWIRFLIGLAVLYVIYVLLGFFVAPPIIRSQIEKRASEQLKRPVTVGHVSFNPLILALDIERLLVKDHDGEPLVGWAKLHVNFQLFDLTKHDIHFSELELDGFAGRLNVSKDGVLNIADIIPPSHAKPSQSSSEWGLSIDRLSVSRAEIEYVDASRPEVFRTHVGPTTFVLREFHTLRGGAPGVFRASTESSESVEWTGNISLAPLRSNGELRVTQFAMKKYAPYYQEYAPFDLLDGTVDVQLPYEFTIENNKPQLRITDAGVQVHHVEIAERGQKDPLITLRDIEIAPIAADLQKMSVEIGRTVFNGGDVVVRRDAQGINLMRLIPASPRNNSASNSTAPAPSLAASSNSSNSSNSASTTPAPTTPAASTWTVKLADLSGKDFNATILDHSTPRPGELQIKNLTFDAKRINSGDLATGVPIEFSTDLGPGGGHISVSGTVAPQPLKADVQVAAENVALAPLSPWAEAFANLRISQGAATVRLRAQASSASNALALGGSGDADITSLVTTDARGGDLMKLRSLGVHGLQYSSQPERLTVTEVALTGPEVSVAISPDHIVSVSTILRQPSGSSPAQAAPSSTVSATPPAERFIAVDRITLNDGVVNFTDESIQPQVRTTVTQLNGTITGATSAEIDRADVNLKGLVNQAAPLAITGKANVLSSDLSADLRLELKNSNLVPLSPYVGKFIGYRLSSGAVTLDAHAKIQKRKLDSSSNVVVTQLALGDATNSPDAPHVPVHLALALLRDSQGKITLDLPVQGSLDDPSFAIGGVVMQVIKNIIVKAATSPFNLIGAMFGGGKSGEELSFVDFAPGEAAMAEDQQRKLDVVAKALQERPGLRLGLNGAADKASDAATLRSRLLEQRLRESVLEDVRRLSPSITSADQIVGYPEAEEQKIAALYQEQFNRRPTPTPPPTLEPEPKQEEEHRRFFLFRWFSHNKQRPKEENRPPVRPSPAPQPSETLATSIKAEATPSLAEMRAKLEETMHVDDRELQQLAASRVEAARQYLLSKGGIAPDRIDVAPDFGTDKRRVTLQLK
ncbi:MAG TPA: DUF748 domain-containing protein [Opitutaceae bacterium]|nr:DUF748 domain-containing protein [Opitutaceae bacterium]